MKLFTNCIRDTTNNCTTQQTTAPLKTGRNVSQLTNQRLTASFNQFNMKKFTGRDIICILTMQYSNKVVTVSHLFIVQHQLLIHISV